MSSVTAILVAGGKGERMGAGLNKVYLPLGNKPVITHCLETIICQDIDKVVVVVAPGEEEYCRQKIIRPLGIEEKCLLCLGGIRRQDSVFEGLKHALPGSLVVIHDAARPFLTTGLWQRTVAAARKYGAAIPGLPVKDTIKLVQGGCVQETLSRGGMWSIQTPQAFLFDILWKAHAWGQEERVTATDDASLVENIGYEVHLVEGDPNNLKITTPEDLKMAHALLVAGLM